MKVVPGKTLPDFGMGTAGIIRRDAGKALGDSNAASGLRSPVPSFGGDGGQAGDLDKSAFERTFAGTIPGKTLPDFGVSSGGIIRRDANQALGDSKAVTALRSPVPSFRGDGSPAGDLDKGGFERTFAGTAMAGKFDQVTSAANANGIEPKLLAGVMAHESGRGKFLSGNNPGGVMDPSTGWSRKKQFADLDAGISATASAVGKNYRRANGDLTKLGSLYAPEGASNDPRSLNGGWVSGVQRQMRAMTSEGTGSLTAKTPSISGSAGNGDAVGYAERFLGKNEYRDTAELAKFMGGRDPRGAANAWCAAFVNSSLKAAGGKGTGSAIANSFQRWGTKIDDLSKIQRNDVLVEPKGRGPDQTGGHVGFATGVKRMKDGRLQLEMLGGNQSDSVSKKFVDADKLMGRRGAQPAEQSPDPQATATAQPSGDAPSLISNTPQSNLIQNVPVSPSITAPNNSAWSGGTGSPVAININGGSHDPEALATLVQRRVDESMNWRTNDVESEYS